MVINTFIRLHAISCIHQSFLNKYDNSIENNQENNEEKNEVHVLPT